MTGPSKPKITHVSNHTPRTVMVHWVEPKEMNGRLQRYQLQWIHMVTGLVKTKVISGVLKYKMSENITNLGIHNERVKITRFSFQRKLKNDGKFVIRH